MALLQQAESELQVQTQVAALVLTKAEAMPAEAAVLAPVAW